MTFVLLYPIAMWFMYILCITLVKAQESLPWYTYPFIAAVILVGYVMDIIFNIVYMSVLTLEPPREFLTTTRCKRLLKSTGWRAKVANVICSKFLHPFDSHHCI